VLIARVHTEFCQFIRQAAPLVGRRLSVFIVERDISVDGASVNSRILKSRALSNNENRTAIDFQTAELSIIEYDIFKFFPTPSTFGTGNGNEAGGFFLSGLVCLITG
jgi:hypothetical protein